MLEANEFFFCQVPNLEPGNDGYLAPGNVQVVVNCYRAQPGALSEVWLGEAI